MIGQPAHTRFEPKAPPESWTAAISFLSAVLLLPLLVLWHQENPLYSGFGYIDPWLSFGFFRNLIEFKRNFFPGSVQGSHLSWILPGAVIHSLFSPIAANYILHLGVYSTATLSLFLTLKLVAGPRRAFLTTLLFSANPWLWSATGWDYGDGAAIAYCLMTMALLTRAAMIATGRWTLFAAGMSMAALVYVNLYWVLLGPVLPLYYICLARVAHRVPILDSFLSLVRWFGGGCVILTLAFGAINYYLDGHFFFYTPAVLDSLNGWSSGASLFHGLVTNQAPSPWLWFVMVAAATAFVVMASCWRKVGDVRNTAAVLFSVVFLGALAGMTFLQARGAPVLGTFYYASYLMPFSFLVIGAWFWPAVDAISIRDYVLICCFSAAALSMCWIGEFVIYLSSSPLVVAIGCAALAAALAMRHRPAGMTFSLMGFMILTTCSVGARYGATDTDRFRRQYELLIRNRAHIESIRQGHAVRFWYDEKDASSSDGIALGSTYSWSNSLLGGSFTAPPCDKELVPSMLVASISSSPAYGRDFVASALTACWSGQGLRATPIANWAVDRKSYVYDMSVLRIEAAPGKWLPVAAVFGSDARATLRDAADSPQPPQFPLQYFVVQPGSDTGAVLRAVSKGIMVRTHASPGSLATLGPVMTAPVAGRYRFAMHYLPGAGAFRFGAYARGRTDPWLAFAAKGNWIGTNDEAAFWIDLAEGQELQLALANANTVHRPASFLMQAVSAIRLRK
jgi:hypothetical protein